MIDANVIASAIKQHEEKYHEKELTMTTLEEMEIIVKHNAELRDENIRLRNINTKLRINRTELRDEFAMAALTGLLASNAEECLGIEHLADTCYKVADQMLKSREIDHP